MMTEVTAGKTTAAIAKNVAAMLIGSEMGLDMPLWVWYLHTDKNEKQSASTLLKENTILTHCSLYSLSSQSNAHFCVTWTQTCSYCYMMHTQPVVLPHLHGCSVKFRFKHCHDRETCVMNLLFLWHGALFMLEVAVSRWWPVAVQRRMTTCTNQTDRLRHSNNVWLIGIKQQRSRSIRQPTFLFLGSQ